MNGFSMERKLVLQPLSRPEHTAGLYLFPGPFAFLSYHLIRSSQAKLWKGLHACEVSSFLCSISPQQGNDIGTIRLLR
ncbi:MAG: hypothetical protein JWN14_4250 [Chthonomonadales bacterium]|nr:hypothetical protein [Chthonomonadales bacterium]